MTTSALGGFLELRRLRVRGSCGILLVLGLLAGCVEPAGPQPEDAGALDDGALAEPEGMDAATPRTSDAATPDPSDRPGSTDRPTPADRGAPEPLTCIGLPAFDLADAEPSGPGELTAWFDTRDAPLRAVSLPPTSCAVHRGRAAAFRYTPVADGPVLLELVEADGLTVEVFEECAHGAAFVGCAERENGWTPALRAGRPVFLVVTSSLLFGQADNREWSMPVRGGLRIVRPEVLPEGASCVGLRQDRRQSCGAGLVCVEGVCARSRVRYCRSQEPRCDAGGRCSGGICVYPRVEREPCEFHEDCADGLRCRTDPDGAQRCRRASTEGDSCDGSDEWGACADGLICLGGRCRPRARAGEHCGSSRPCEAGLACLGGVCTPRRAEPHGVCDPTDPNGCPEGWACLFGRCVDGALGLGAPCQRGVDLCAQGLECDGTRCRDTRRAPGVCAAESDCAAWEACHENRCAGNGTLHGACRETNPSCDEGLRCVGRSCLGETVCENSLHSGARCGAGRACSRAEYLGGRVSCVDEGAPFGRCRSGMEALARGECDGALRCVDGFCASPIAAGAFCNDTTACAEGFSCGPSRRCVPSGSLGADCQVVAGRRVCDEGLRCVWGFCRPSTAGPGGSCSDTNVPWNDAEYPTCRAGLECLRGRCVAIGDPGAPCGPEARCRAGLSCRYTQRGHWFDGNISWDWSCVAVQGEGGACRETEEPTICEEGLVCDAANRCVQGTTSCRPVEPRCPQGTRCVSHIQYTRWEGLHAHTVNDAYCSAGAPVWSRVDYDICAPGLLRRYDDRSGFNLCFPTGEMGAPCRPTDGGCAAPLQCVGGVCAIAAGEGEACNRATTDARRCTRELDCLDGGCRRWGTAGATCRVSDPPCDPGLACHNGVCGERLAADATCAVPRAPCAEGYRCTPTSPFRMQCLREGALGGLCRYDRSPLCDEGLRCARGLCVSGA
ncbi:MAG: hypothetical protein R3A48_00375 [Polyangiales bacterium]